MLKRQSNILFPNATVFIGGKVEAEDYKKSEDATLRTTAIRELTEESGISSPTFY